LAGPNTARGGRSVAVVQVEEATEQNITSAAVR